MSKTSVVYTATGRCQTRSHVKAVEGFNNVHQIEGGKQEDSTRRGGTKESVAVTNKGNMAKGEEGYCKSGLPGLGGRRICKSISSTDITSKSKGGRKSKSPGTRLQGPSEAARQKKPLEVIYLSDSEDKDTVPLPKPARVPSNSLRNSKKGSENARNAGPAASTVVLDSAMKTPPPKKDIEEYYRSKGLSLSHVRRLNRNYVRHDGLPGEARGVVFWDSFSPPPGYTMEDLPASDSQGNSQPEEPPKPTVSPAILLAEKYKHKHRRVVCPKATDADFEEISQRLTKRKVHDNDNEAPENPNPTKRSTPETKELKGSGLPEPVSQSSHKAGQSDTFNGTFPSFEDDLNDSALMLCSQQVETEYNQMKENKDDAIAVNNSKLPEVGNYEDFKPHTFNSGGPIGASTPITDEFVIRKRSIVPATPFINKDQSENSSSMSLFENSVDCGLSCSGNSRRLSSCVVEPAKKVLFDLKSPEIPKSPKISGDFMDDDDDELFSQIEMPVEPVKSSSKTVPQKGMQNDLANMPTQLINNDENRVSKNLRTDSCLMSHKVAKVCVNDGVRKRCTSPFKLFKKLQVELTALSHQQTNTSHNLRKRNSFAAENHKH